MPRPRFLHPVFLLAGLLTLPFAASAEAVFPGVDASTLDPALKGRVLLEELNCAACHESPALAPSSRKAPRLAGVGARVHPDYLRSFIAHPHRVKPGTTMPDVLGDLDDGERRDAAEAITHFLVSLSKGPGFSPQAPDAVAAEQGAGLFHSVGCVACHSPRDGAGEEILPATSIPLGRLHEKYSHRSLAEFLQRPHAVRPSGRMPDLRLPAQEIERISHYLLRETRVPGHLAFTTWRGNVWEGLDGDVQKERAGQVDEFTLEALGRIQHQTAVRYEGFLSIKTAGTYTFHLQLNGGSLRIGSREIVSQEPSNRRGPMTLKGNATLAAGKHPIEVVYFHTGREPRFVFEMEGPGFAKGAIPSVLLSVSEEPIPAFAPLQADPELAQRGKALVTRFGCAQCHDDVGEPSGEFPPLAGLRAGRGCLGESDTAPRFALADHHRNLIAQALPTSETATLTEEQTVNKSLTALNCIACHEREGLGGVSPDRDSYFTGTREALGDQGRLPPPLTHVGAKLTREWLAEVLLHGGRQREYLNTRMPLFGEAQVAPLVELFGKVDSLEEATFPQVSNIRESKEAGYDMIGTEGFSCIACHDYNGQEAGGAGALDLVHATERLQKNWFHLYMRSPSRFHPTVIMPSYWPGGVSIRKDVLDGETDRQIEALWNYLSDGPRARKPKGLSRQSLHLRVADEPVMCRGRGTAGYRGIGVGYPERISLAFDSEEMALRLLWKGEFADINHGSFRARGQDRISFPPGIPFHRLESLDHEWPYKGKTDYLFPQDHGYQYRGYHLDKEKYPTFHYHYGEITVEDRFEDLLDEDGNAFFRRTLRFSAPGDQESFFFRVASGKEITKDGHSWKIDQLTIRLPEGQSARVREGDPMELLLPLEIPQGNSVLTVEYQW